MSNIVIFVFGLFVTAVVLASSFIYLLSTDYPNEK